MIWTVHAVLLHILLFEMQGMTNAWFLCGRVLLCIWTPGMSVSRLACKSTSKYPQCVLTVCVSVLYVPWRMCQDPRCSCLEVLWCKLALAHRAMRGHQPASLPPTELGCSIPTRQPEQWVEPMAVWLVWLGGKWKPLSRLFSLPHPNAKHRREVIWIAKAALATLIWHWTISIGGCAFCACWFCFVLSCVLKWASLSTVTPSMGRRSTGWVPQCSWLVIFAKKKKKCEWKKPFRSFTATTEDE